MENIDLLNVVSEVEEILADIKYVMESMRNCVNCCHYDVCLTVNVRKAHKANDYSPCEYWKLKAVKQ